MKRPSRIDSISEVTRADRQREQHHEFDALQTLVTEIRSEPGNFRDSNTIVSRSGSNAGIDKLADLFQKHYHIAPHEMLIRSKIEAARRLLITSEFSVVQIAILLDFPSAAEMEYEFTWSNGLSPDDYRKLRTDSKFTVQLPLDYPIAHLYRTLGRDSQSITERLSGNDYTIAIRLGEESLLVTLKLYEQSVDVMITQAGEHTLQVHAIVVGLIGLGQNTSGFAALVADLGLNPLIAGRASLPIHQTISIFSGLLWTIIGQQINMPFAFKLQRRLIEKTGTPMGNGLFAPPTPETLAKLDPAELLPLQFSRQKASYIISTARLLVDGQLELEPLRSMPASNAKEKLLAVKGLGPWSVNYLMMRSLGFGDCLPLGDTSVTSGLRSLFQLDEKPNLEETLRLTGKFSPFRSLAIVHLWLFGEANAK